MPSLTEEDPEYPQKVQAFLKKRDIDRLPWGFIVVRGHMVCTRSTVERQHRGFLGEIAMELLAKQGVSTDDLEAILAGEVTARKAADLPDVKEEPLQVPAEDPAPSDPLPGT